MCAVNVKKMCNVIKPCFNSVSLIICRGPGDILCSYFTQSIRGISYCYRATWNMLSHCIANHSHWTLWWKVSQGKLYLYVYWYGMTPKSWSAHCGSIRLDMNWTFSVENLNLSRNSLSSKSNSIWRYTLSFCCWLISNI